MLITAEIMFSRYVTNQTRLYVVCCGQRVDSLVRLLAKGISIQYLLVPSPMTVDFPTHPALECRVLDGMNTRMRAFHFAFSESPSMFWLERKHTVDSMTALDCEWMPPEHAEHDSRLAILKENFATAWKLGHPLVRQRIVL